MAEALVTSAAKAESGDAEDRRNDRNAVSLPSPLAVMHLPPRRCFSVLATPASGATRLLLLSSLLRRLGTNHQSLQQEQSSFPVMICSPFSENYSKQIWSLMVDDEDYLLFRRGAEACSHASHPAPPCSSATASQIAIPQPTAQLARYRAARSPRSTSAPRSQLAAAPLDLREEAATTGFAPSATARSPC